jgi:hypothetical protein
MGLRSDGGPVDERNPFDVVSRKYLYQSRIFGHREETRGYPDVFCRLEPASPAAFKIVGATWV